MQGDPLLMVTSAPGIQGNQTAPAVQFNNCSHREDRKRLPHYNGKAAVATGTMQIFCGVLAILLEIIYLKSRRYLSPSGKVAVGIWGGALFIFTGLIGIYSAQKKRGMIIVYFVLSIICSVTALIGFLFAVRHTQNSAYSNYPDMALVVSILLLIVTATESLTAIIASSFGCAARLCCSGQPTIQERVIYMATPQAANHTNDFPMEPPPSYQASQVVKNV